MIRVTIHTKNSDILEMEVKGHADSAEYGKDLVCAGVSSITTGLLNALDEYCKDTCELELRSGYVHVKVNENTHDNQLILAVGITQLETIALTNKEFIRIEKMEV